MKVVKLLERKEVIRLFGGGLILAPLFNSYFAYLALSTTSALGGATGFQGFWKVVLSGTTAQHVLDIASLLIGLLLLTGLRAAWKWMLVLLGGYMAMQIAHLGQSLRNNPLNGLFFIANVGLFLFIADQLAFKQKGSAQNRSPQPATQPAPKPVAPIRQAVKPATVSAPQTAAKPAARVVAIPAKQKVQAKAKPVTRRATQARRSRAKIFVHFQGVGSWAQVVSISPAGIELRSSGPAPIDIENREVEMNLAPDLWLKARLKSRTGSLYFFEYIDLAPGRISKLNQWLLAQAS